MTKAHPGQFVMAASVFLFACGAARLSSAAVETICSTACITIPSLGAASPYPTTISIGVSGSITDVNLTLFNVNHTFPSDFGALLVGPDGKSVVLFNGAGGGSDVVNADWKFDDDAAGPLSPSGPLASGTFEPSNDLPGRDFAPGAPSGPYGSALSIFNGTNPLGTWSLYVQDFVDKDEGKIREGWSLNIIYTPSTIAHMPEPTSALVWSLLGLATIGSVRLRNWDCSATACR
jgi:subtilisin-like proprotein convertase family protein